MGPTERGANRVTVFSGIWEPLWEPETGFQRLMERPSLDLRQRSFKRTNGHQWYESIPSFSESGRPGNGSLSGCVA